MFFLSNNPRIFLYQEITDMRKGFEGLMGKVQETFPNELTSGAFFVFVNKSNNRMKVLYWDSDGLALWYKRLEKGKFAIKNAQKVLLNRREFMLILEGITPKYLDKRYAI